ncbi:MAG: glyoxalase [Xanthomonadales bacterium]|nr:glyoxalase [Xanthomonadales bacterium]
MLAATPFNTVDGKDVPVPHFGVVLHWHDFESLAEHLKSQAVQFLIEPSVRFVGLPGEQATMFLADPSGNMLEFKAMRDPDQLFSA